MLDFIAVDTPFQFPQACVGCQSQKGPLVDTHREIPGYGHVYVCHICAKTIARIMGYAPGKRLDELSNASKQLVEAGRQIELMNSQIGQLAWDSEQTEALLRELREDNERKAQRIEQLEEKISEEAKAMLAVVGED